VAYTLLTACAGTAAASVASAPNKAVLDMNISLPRASVAETDIPRLRFQPAKYAPPFIIAMRKAVGVRIRSACYDPMEARTSA
jgi:hypothetical protein